MTTRATTKAGRATKKRAAAKQKATARKATKKSAAKKSAAKKSTAKKSTAKKSATKKSATKKSATKKSATKKSATKKSATKKAATKKAGSKKTSAKKVPAAKAKSPAAAKQPVSTAKAPKQPGLLAPDVEKELLGKLKKARYESQVENHLEKLVPAGLSHADVLWDLAQRGRLPLDNTPVVDEFMDWPAPSPAALATMWSRFKPEWSADHATQFPGAPSFLFAIVYNAIEADPDPWVAAVDTLPEPLRGAVWLELAELKAAELPPEVRDDLRARLLTDPFDDSRVSVVDNLQILGLDDETVARELLQRLPADRPVSLANIEIVLRHADFADVARILGSARPSNHDVEAVGRVLRARNDSVDALVRLAVDVRAKLGRGDEFDRFEQALADVALERCQAIGVTPPAELDEAITFAWSQSPFAAPGLAALPRERLQALIRRELAGEPAWQRTRVFPAVRHAFDEALFGELLAIARTAVQGTASRSNNEPLALGAVGPQAIPALERALAAALEDTTFERDYHKNRWITQLRKAIAVALLDVARAGQPIDARWDELLGPHPECLDWNIIDEVFNGGRPFGQLLALLPEARSRAILDAWLAADPNGKHNVRDWLERELPESLGHLLAPAETLIDRLRRLVIDTGLEADTRIYVLEPHDEREPNSPNRVCSAPRGLSDARWPLHEKAKMEHVLTLDLDQAPELRRLAAELNDARALALFISSRNENSAWSADNDETALIGLTEAELAAGHDEEGGSFAVHPLDVPRAVFGETAEGTPLHELRSALWKLHGRALGEPYWLQDDEWTGDLLLQFDEGLAFINLGDSGMMYVFADTAFWQCY